VARQVVEAGREAADLQGGGGGGGGAAAELPAWASFVGMLMEGGDFEASSGVPCGQATAMDRLCMRVCVASVCAWLVYVHACVHACVRG